MCRYFICLCIWKQSWNTLESVFGGYFGRHLGNHAIVVIDFFIFELQVLRLIWTHFMCLCIWKRSWDALNSDFWWPSLPPSWKICNCWYWFLHIQTLRPSLYMTRHYIFFELNTFVSVSERRAEIHSIQNSGGHDFIWKNSFFIHFRNSSEVITISFWGQKRPRMTFV